MLCRKDEPAAGQTSLYYDTLAVVLQVRQRSMPLCKRHGYMVELPANRPLIKHGTVWANWLYRSTPAMTHNKLHPLIDRLEERQTAFQNRRGTAQPAHYLGHGGQLSLPDGRPYEAY